MRFLTLVSFAIMISVTIIFINSQFYWNNNENKRLEFEEFLRNHPFNQKETLTPAEWKKK